VQRPDQRTRRHVEREARPIHGGDLAERDGELFVETDRQRNRVRPELDRRRAERIRGLHRMPALHAPIASLALPHVDIKAPDDRGDWRQILLILVRDVGLAYRPAAAGTGRRHRQSCVSCTTAGTGRWPRRPYALPGLRPGRRGRRFGAPFENGAAWRVPARRAASNSSFNRVFSRSRRARSRSTRTRSASDRSSSQRNRAFSRWSSSIGSVGFCSARPLTRLLC
jgi:hypothetical protein